MEREKNAKIFECWELGANNKGTASGHCINIGTKGPKTKR